MGSTLTDVIFFNKFEINWISNIHGMKRISNIHEVYRTSCNQQDCKYLWNTISNMTEIKRTLNISEIKIGFQMFMELQDFKQS